MSDLFADVRGTAKEKEEGLDAPVSASSEDVFSEVRGATQTAPLEDKPTLSDDVFAEVRQSVRDTKTLSPYRREVAKEAFAAEPVASSASRVDMLLENPEMLADMNRREEERKQANIAMDWSGEFTQEEETTPRTDWITVEELAASGKFVDMASRYLTKRWGKEMGNVDNYDSNEDFIKRYLQYTRKLAVDNTEAAHELSRIYNASEEEKRELAALYSLDPNIANAGTIGGDTLWNAVSDYTVYAATDPTNWVTALGAFAVKQTAKYGGSKFLQESLKKQVPTLVTTMGVDGVLDFWDSGNRQSIEVQLGLKDDVSYTEAGLQALTGVALQGAIDVSILKRQTGQLSAAEDLDLRLNIDPEQAAKDAAEIAKKRMAESDFDPELGAQVRQQLSRGELFTNLDTNSYEVVAPEINKITQEKVLYAVETWANDNKTLANALRSGDKETRRISDFVREAIAGEDVELAESLQKAMDKAGVSSEEFSQAFRGSVQEAARTLGNLSAFKRKMDALAGKSPVLAESLDRMYRAEVASFTSKAKLFVSDVDRATRSILVSSPMTTMRNIIGNTAHMSVDVFTDMTESVLYHTQLAATNAATGQQSKGVVRSMRDIWQDSFTVLSRLRNQADQQVIIDRLLDGHETIESRLLHTVQDAGEEQAGRHVPALVNSLQYFNRVQDGFFRRAIFNNRVDFYLRRSGVEGGIETVIKEGRQVDTKILQKAMEEAMDRTFSKTYTGDSIGRSFVNLVEKVPFVLTTSIPFPRYTANAVEFLYKHMPVVGVATGGVDIATGVARKEAKETAAKKGMALTNEQVLDADMLARQKMARAVSGTGAFFVAYQTVLDDPDTEWKYLKDPETGRLHDITTVGPLAVFRLMAKYVHDVETKGETNIQNSDIIDAVAGLNLNFQTDTYNLLELSSAFATGDSEGVKGYKEDKFLKALGYVAGDVVGRAAQPLVTVSDVLTAFDPEEGKVRDIKQLPEDAGFKEAFTASVQKKLPLAKQDLQEYPSATSEKTLRKEAPLAALLSGTRIEKPRTLVEEEIERAGIQLWSVAPNMPDKTAQAIVTKRIQPFINGMLADRVDDEDFQSKTKLAKAQAINNWLQEIRVMAKDMAYAYAEDVKNNNPNAVNRLERNMWLQLPESKRKYVNEYLTSQGEKPVEESKQYMLGVSLSAMAAGER